MATIITRVGKGSPLTNAEVDANFTNLNSELATKADSSLLASYQPLDSDLSAIAGLSGNTGILRKTGANAWALDTSTYLTSFTETDPIFSASPAAGITGTNISNWNTAYGWGNHASAGYLTSYTETDPTVGSHIKAITTTNINNWNTAFGWGNHASAGYITSSGSITGNAGTVSAGITSNLNTIPSGLDAGEATFQRYDINAANKPVTVDNANGVLTMISHPVGGVGLYGKQIAFGDNDDLYMRYLMDGSFGSWRTLWHSGSGTISAVNDLRAPIFYDSNDTGYYVNPNSASLLVALGLQADEGLNVKGIRGGFSAGSDGQGIHLFSNVDIGYPSGWGVGLSNTPSRGLSVYGGGRFSYGGSGFLSADTSVRAPIFYDSGNTAYYVDPNSGSRMGNITADNLESLGSLTVNSGPVYRSSWVAGFQSQSDFADGTLVATDIPANISDGDSFLIEITGKSYSSTVPPFKVVAQGYIYANTFISCSGISYGGDFPSSIKVLEQDGVLKVWWARLSYWNSFEVRVIAMNGPTNGNITRNRVTGITNSAEPSVSKKVTIGLASYLRADVAAANTVDLRAPIFYDYNNTSYYIDAAGTSVLNNVNVSSLRNAAGSAAMDFSSADYNLLRGADGAIRFYVGRTALPTYYDNDAHYFRTNSGAVTQMTITGNGNAIAYVDMRAPVFYDNGDTSFYLDAAGNSALNGIFLRSSGTTNVKAAVGSYFGYSAGYKTVILGGDSMTTISIGVDVSGNASGSFNGQGDGREVIFRNGVQFITPNAANNSYHAPLGMVDGYVYSAGSVRAPIFYDTDNTGYYVNPAGTSNLASITLADTITIAGIYGRSAAGIGYLSGGYNGAETNSTTGPIYCISTGYAPTSTTLGSMYGIGYTDGGGSGVWSGGGWGMYAAAGGVARVFLDAANGIVYSTASVRSPIFYDSNNTAYYIDAASNSALYQLTTGVGINLNGGIALNASGATLANSTGARLTENYGPLWNLSDSATWHHQVINGSMLCGFLASGTNWGSGKVVANSDMRAPIFYDYNNTGYYLDPQSGSRLGGQILFDGGSLVASNGDITARRSNGTTGVLYFAGGSPYLYWNGTEYVFSTTGPVTTGIDMRASLFYDVANTGYYIDPASTSNLNGLNVGGRNMRRYGENRYIEFTVGGDANTYYPVLLQLAGTYFEFAKWSITRHYADTAPWDPIGTGVHRGGLTLTWCWSGDGAWGGNDKAFRVEQFNESYTTIVGGMQLSVNGMIVWLRGGGATYKFHGTGGMDNGVNVYLSTFEAANGATFAPRSYNATTVTNEIMARFPIRNSGNGGELWDGNTRVLSDDRWINGKYFGSNSSVYGGIFYDSSDSSYYVDPASGSVLRGGVTIHDNGTAASPLLDIRADDGGPWGIRLYRSDLGGGAQMYASSATHWYHSGALRAAAAMYAPIFYDEDNTAYYVDPSGGSKIRGLLQVEGDHYNTEIRLTATGLGSGVNSAMSWWVSEPNVTWNEGGFGFNVTNDGGTPNGFGRLNTSFGQAYTRYTTSGNMAFYCTDTGGTRYNVMTLWSNNTIGVDNILSAAGSLRAPLFYDSNNTGFYVDPAGTSNLDRINLGDSSKFIRGGASGQTILGVGTVNDAYLQVGGNYYTVWNSGQSTFTASSDFRAPLFYDSNNTGFYIDPASTSNINQLNANGKIVLETFDSFLRINQYNGFSSGIWMGPSNIGGSGELHLGSNGTPSTARVRVIGGTYNGSVAITLNGSDGSITAAGNITAFSDIRVKDNVDTIADALAKLSAVRGVTYTRTDLDDKERVYAGVIAQEIEQVLPEAVREINDIKTVDYNATIALLIQAVKELNAKVWNLEAQLATK